MSKRKKPRRAWGEGSVTETPNGKHKAVVTVGTDAVTGKQLRESKTFPTRQEAVAWKALRLAARGKGDAGRAWTVAGWMTHWLAARKQEVEYGTWRSYNSRSKLFIVPRLGAAKLADLTRVAVDRWRGEMARDDVPAGQVFRATKTLRLALSDAVEAGVLGRNPVGKVRRPKVQKSAIHPLTKEQALAFLAESDRTQYAALWRLFLDAGPRPGELVALHWPDVDLDAGTVHFHRSLDVHDDGTTELKPPKTPRGDRVVMIAPATAAALAARREALRGKGQYDPEGLVFAAPRGGFLPPLRLNEGHWVPLRERAKLPKGVRMYDLRHTSATLLVQAGESLAVVADRLGHEDPSITLKHYVKYLPTAQASARDRIQALFG